MVESPQSESPPDSPRNLVMNYDMVEHENKWEGPANIVSGMLIQAVRLNLLPKLLSIDDWFESNLGKHHSLHYFLSKSLQSLAHHERILHYIPSINNHLCYLHASRSLYARKNASKTTDRPRCGHIRCACDLLFLCLKLPAILVPVLYRSRIRLRNYLHAANQERLALLPKEKGTSFWLDPRL